MTAPSPPRSSRLADVLAGACALLLVVLCVAYLTVRHVLWPRLDGWRDDLVVHLERGLQRPVSIGPLRPGWEGLHPTLEIESLRIDGGDGEPRLQVPAAYVRVSWWSLLWGAPRLAALRLVSPELVVERLALDRFAVAGLEPRDAPGEGGHPLDWLAAQGELVVERATVRFVDRVGELAEHRLQGIDAALVNAGRHHQARFEWAGAAPLAGPLRAVADLHRPPFSRASDATRWRGQAHLAGERVDVERVAALARALGLPEPAAALQPAGRLDALAWLRFHDGRLEDTTLKVQGEALSVTLAAGRLALREARAEVTVNRRDGGGHAVVVSNLAAVDPEGFRLGTDGRVELEVDGQGGLRAGWLRLASFDAQGALAAARRLPLPEPVLARLQRVELAGTVRDLTLRWSDPRAPLAEARPADRSADLTRRRESGPRIEATSSFERLSLRVQGAEGTGLQPPGFRNLSGTLRASERDGAVTLSGRGATLSFPGVFAEPDLPFDRLEAALHWTDDPARGEHRWEVDVTRLAFANADARGEAVGRWRSGGKGPGLVALNGRVDRIDARRVPRYLPVALPAGTRAWVERAVTAGTVENVVFETRGDLWDFPFRNPEEGTFRIAGRVRDGTLAYAPGWPRIDQIRGDLVFERAGMDVRAQAGQIGRVRLSDVHARITEYREAVVTIDGRGAGPAQDMLGFIDDSPLAATVATFTRDIRADGDARLGLKLVLPLDDLDHTRVAGTVDLPGNDVELDRTLPRFAGVTGRLEFTERGLSLPELQATFLGGPLRIEGRAAGEGRMRIDASGSIDADGMRSVVDNPLTRRLAGRTDYRATIDVDRRASTLRIESDLVGLSSDLPAPFAKPASAAWPLRVVSTPLAPREPGARPPGDRLDVRLRQDIALALERRRDPGTERLRVSRAGFAIDAEPVLRDAGLSVLLHTDRIDVDAWMAVLGDGELERLQAEGASAGLSLVPDLVSVVADDLRIGGRDLHEVVLGATRLEGRWRANVAAREVQGHFEWHHARPGERIGTLVARFDRLVLPRSREGEVESMLSASPMRLPGLDLSAEQLVLGTVPVGRLTLSATNGGTAAGPVWTLDRLVLVNPTARLEARGSWSLAAGRGAPTAALGAPAPASAGGTRATALDFSLEIQDAGSLLARFGLVDVVRGGSGRLAGTVNWRGTPLAIDYPSLDGRMQLSLGEGEFLKVDPGPAKLIGVLNMQSLPKRLSGDFRDLFGEGFAFDTIGGHVQIDRGIARTDDLRMRGVQAQVRIRGQADIQHETQKLNVEVVPEFNAGIASIAFGAMVNPAIGLGSLAAQYVLRKPLQEALSYEIDVTGSWSDPMVSERMRRAAAPPPAQPQIAN